MRGRSLVMRGSGVQIPEAAPRESRCCYQGMRFSSLSSGVDFCALLAPNAPPEG